MSKLIRRIECLEKTAGKGLQKVRLVFSEEEAIAARQEIGENGLVIHIISLDAVGHE